MINLYKDKLDKAKSKLTKFAIQAKQKQLAENEILESIKQIKLDLICLLGSDLTEKDMLQVNIIHFQLDILEDILRYQRRQQFDKDYREFQSKI